MTLKRLTMLLLLSISVVITGILITSAPAQAGTGDGTVLGATTIVDNGPNDERFNLVIIGEGFTAAQQNAFNTAANDLVNALFAFSPFDTLNSAFNVVRLNVASNESGADDPAECGGSDTYVNTYFDASFCNGGIRRLLVVNSSIAIGALNSWTPQWDQAVVIVNSSIYGGSGGTIGVTSLTGSWEGVVIHEMGHSAFGLADEYEYWAGCGIDTDRDQHSAFEPSEPNVTVQTNPALLKWSHLVTPGTPIPTTTNDDCTRCDNQGNPFPEMTVGTYEGAHYYHCGAYRPQFYCMMRDLTDYYCAVCQEAVTTTLGPFIPLSFEGIPRGGPESATVTFASHMSGTAWKWYFGDGDSSMIESPSHTYGPGGFDVTLIITTPFGERTTFAEDYITVWADTIVAPDREDTIGTGGYWEINYANATPISELILPVSMTNVMSLVIMDSVTFTDTRLAQWEFKQIVFDNHFNGEVVYRLKANNGGDTPPLEPGTGPIARVYYRIRSFAAVGDTTYLSTPPLGAYALTSTTPALDFEPVSYGATMRFIKPCGCPYQCNFDENAVLDAVDLNAEIQVLYFNAFDPQDLSCPATRADFDGDGFSDATDFNLLVQYLFFNGAPPADPCEP